MTHARKMAVVLAVDHFDDEGIQDLQFAEDDGREWTGFLKYRLQFDDVQSLFGKSLRKDDAMDLIEDRARALSRAGGGTFWVVYAGHAVLQDGGRQLLLCPRVRRDLLSNGIEDHTVPVEQIRLQTAFPGVDRVIVPDACRSPLESGTRDAAELETGMRGLRDMVPLKGSRQEGGWGVLCACSDREKAQELKVLRRGLFSHTAMQLWEDDLRAGREVRLTHGFIDRVNAAMARVAEIEKLSRRQHAWMQLNFPAPLLRPGRVESRDAGDPEAIEVAPRPSLASRVAARRSAHQKAFEADWQEYVAARPRLGRVELLDHWVELCQSHGVEAGSVPGDLAWTAEGVRRVSPAASAPAPSSAPAFEPGTEGRIGDVFRTDIGMDLQWIPSGRFLMGSPAGVGAVDERPQTKVTIIRPFWMGRFPVRQWDWKVVMGSSPSRFSGDDRPVERVTWEECQEFARRLSERMRGRMPPAYHLRLPTEVEWEYACRAGTATRWSFGDDEALLQRYAWIDRNSGGQTQPVGQKPANPWGLFDMHGGVWEWCRNPKKSYTELLGAVVAGGSREASRVIRGGSWFHSADFCRSANRNSRRADDRADYVGFRLVLAPTTDS